MLRIVLTGGPCGGKSTAKSKLMREIGAKLGMKVFWVPETPTELMSNGIIPDDTLGMDFQELVTDKQLSKQAIYDKAASYYDSDNVIIFYDRGLLDQATYMGMEPLKQLLKRRGLSLKDIYSMYDAVLHLVTAADGAEEYYQWNDPSKEDCGNNEVRSEHPELARKLDLDTRNAWIGHPHFRIFDNSTDFDTKINRVVSEVFSLLGKPVPTEIERKFLIKKPTAKVLESLGFVSKVNIVQTYLKDNGSNAERRIRQWGNTDKGFIYFYTEKIETDIKIKRIEKERKIEPVEYASYMSDADTSLHQISKTRHYFVSGSKYFELDIYPFSDEYAVLEVEVNDINEVVNLPKELDIIKEVTENTGFRNKQLARTMRFPEI